MQKMQQLKYEVKFLTPAFLGNAEQRGQWRTPPFKALLRQWWRVAVAQEVDYDHKKLREREAILFGHAWWEGDEDSKENKVPARSSALRMRLNNWTEGRLRSWDGLEPDKVDRPEVRQKVGPLLYLGYGPLHTKKKNAAINAGESAELSIAAPAEKIPRICNALALMNAFGTIGGRGRNGWGSFALIPTSGAPALHTDIGPFLRDWHDCLDLDWPHALGRDGKGPLIWQTTKTYADWKTLMRDLAIVKIGLRTMFKFPSARPHPKPLDRHWLSYPITKHGIKAMSNARLPNSLRFKVRPSPENPGQLRGVIFHVPCLPPPEFEPDRYRTAIKKVWTRVHQFLDGPKDVPLERIPE